MGFQKKNGMGNSTLLNFYFYGREYRNKGKQWATGRKSNTRKDNSSVLKEKAVVGPVKASGANVGEETVTYRRVQGGEGDKTSRSRVVVDNDGDVYINNKDKDLNISVDNGEHSQYFIENKRPGADLIEFPEPWSDWIEEYATNGRITKGGK